MTNVIKFRSRNRHTPKPASGRSSSRNGPLVQWASVAVLLGVLVFIQYTKPEWTNLNTDDISIPSSTKNEPDRPINSSRKNVYEAIDGDSFKIGKTEVRLHGIDAPEYRQTCQDANNRALPCGKLARDELSKLIKGNNINCSLIEKDRYGRELAACSSGGIDINREMIRRGWAVSFMNAPPSYLNAQREAKAAKRGIWAWKFEMPQAYRNRNRAIEGHLAGD